MITFLKIMGTLFILAAIYVDYHLLEMLQRHPRSWYNSFEIFAVISVSIFLLLVAVGVWTSRKEESTPWVCFHCRGVFDNDEAAREHFGSSLGAEAGCKIDIFEYRRMEDNHRLHLLEDSELHRQLGATRAEMYRKEQEAEEAGYARGLKDARGLETTGSKST